MSETSRVVMVQEKICWTALIILAFTNLTALVGIVYNIPVLYLWNLHGEALELPTIISFLFLGLSLWFNQSAFENKPYAKGFSLVCLLFPLVFNLSEIFQYFRYLTFYSVYEHISLEEFISPSNPVSGHIAIYCALALLVAALALFLYQFSTDKPRAVLPALQIPGILLINLGAFGFAVNLGSIPLFRYFVSLPATVAIFCLGIAFLFFPVAGSYRLIQPFFASYGTRRLLVLLLAGWGTILLWQSLISNIHFQVISNPLLGHTVLDTLFQIGSTSFIFTLSLYMLGMLDENIDISHQLREALENYALLAATLSHDLKTPLQTEIQAIDMVNSGRLGGQLSDKEKKLLKAVNENNRFELELVYNLIELFRFETQSQLDIKPIEVNLLLDEVRTELLPLAEQKKQLLLIHPFDNPPYQIIETDALRLKRVLHNLINNAIKHLSPHHRIDVQISRLGEAWLRFEVRDNGPGIPLETQKKLFQRFKPGPSQTFESSGLGLYISKQTVGQLGGQIGFESTPETGTTFYFTLPLVLRTPAAHSVSAL